MAISEPTLRRDHPPNLPHRCALDAIDRTGSLDPELVAIEARRIADGRGPTGIAVERAAWDRIEQVIHDYDRLPRSGDTVYGFAVGLYPMLDYPTLPRSVEDA